MRKFYRWHRTVIGKLAFLLLSLGIFCTGILVLWVANLKLPDFASFEERRIVQSTKIYDRTGKVLLYNLGENLRRTVLPATEISRLIKNATVAIEDWNFYNHHGIRPTSIIRAFISNTITSRTTQGGSTITQQVVKNALLTNKKSIARKLKEAILAIILDRTIKKDEILAMYLNESPYGGNIYGVEEASQAFFGKPASEVTLAEAAYLASLPKAPTYYSPYGNHIDELEKRKSMVLQRMTELGFITKEEEAEARKEKVKFLPVDNFLIKAPHFVFYVRSYLEEKYGKETVDNGGLKVISTLDWEMQKEAEEVVKEFAPINEANFKAKNAGVVAIDPTNGKILAMVGSRDYFEKDNDGNFNVTLAKRQPGSAFKPFVYATAFMKGYTPDTILFDLPTQFQTTCNPDPDIPASNDNCYLPVNYDGLYRGPISMRNALAQSINIPSIETLYLAGIKNSLATARVMGITTLSSADRYGLTLVLGGGEITLLELTGAYGVFAQNGIQNNPVAVERINKSDGTILEEFRPKPKRVLDENIARTINDVLSDNVARAPAFGTNSPLYFPDRAVAAKTGTTNDYRDMWIVGYAPSLVLGAWVGNNDNSSMEKKVAGFVVAPMWHKLMASYLENKTNEQFSKPLYSHVDNRNIKPILRGIWQGGVTYEIDSISGKLATDYTPRETIKEQVLPNTHSILHWLNKEDPLGPAPLNPELDSQYRYWETPVRKWVLKNGYLSFAINTIESSTSSMPSEYYDDVHGPSFLPQINLTLPLAGTKYSGSDRITIKYLIVKQFFPISESEFYLNDEYLGKTNYPTDTFSFIPNNSVTGEQTIKIKVYDIKRNLTQISVNIEIISP
ncbi:MAG TPA: PBP1A family penicillin-binding protein [Candidatus Paceibacterota bacterium]